MPIPASTLPSSVGEVREIGKLSWCSHCAHATLPSKRTYCQKHTKLHRKDLGQPIDKLLTHRKEDEPWVDISDKRLPNTKLGSLYSGSQFKGEQKCGDNKYEVMVELQQVNVKESTVCGYLYIKGLTSELPELTTYFEGEIIGPKYSFLTRKWQATQDTDRQHWELFESFKPYIHCFHREDTIYDPIDSDVVYMRWKERFLVPNHRVSTIDGASFAGFYYIVYKRSTNNITGFYYYHINTERYQALTLEHIGKPYFENFEFR
ncbi:vacuolar import and degradation protein-domain-containing protein [Spinellus fusiger]|nr:vacuolar import and degradation protein-domain-containing protein [Spinellus fusiger]